MRIFKYPLQFTDKQIVEIKGLCRVLSVCNQKEQLVLYCSVFENSETIQKLEVQIIGTGHHFVMCHGHPFLGTVLMHNGELVWHVFYKRINE